MTITLDTDRFALLRLERGLAIRQVALDAGIDIAVLNRLDDRGIDSAPSLTLAQFLRLAETLDVDPADLLSERQASSAPSTPEADIALLGALLHDMNGAVPAVVIAAALGWTLPHTHEVVDVLNDRLRPAGLTVHRRSGRMALRPINDRHRNAAIAARQHPRTALSHRIMNPERARLVRKAMTAPLSQHALSEGARIHTAMLIRTGILRLDSARDVAITHDVQASLYPDGPEVPDSRTQQGD